MDGCKVAFRWKTLHADPYGKWRILSGIYHEKGVFCRLSAGAIFLEVIRDGYVSVSDEIMKLGKKEEL